MVCYTVCVKIGILVHVYHLEVLGWEKVVWGDPARDALGTLTRFADRLLDIPADEQVTSIMYSGPSSKDGLREGEYAKQYLVDRIEKLRDFSRLRRKIERLSPQEYQMFVGRIRGLTLGHNIRNTMHEIESAATYFRNEGADKVLQIASATHAPRCVQLQVAAREAGLIDADQQWFVMASETCFAGGSALDIVIREPAHRGDDPLLGIHPNLPEILRRYQYELSPADRVEALRRFDRIVTELAPKPVSAEPVLETS